MTQVTVPPIESLASLARIMRYVAVLPYRCHVIRKERGPTLVIRSDVPTWGQRVVNLSTSSRVTVASNVRNSGDSASSVSSLPSSSFAALAEGAALDEGKRIFPTEDTKATISIP
jgi:hypothetical protein